MIEVWSGSVRGSSNSCSEYVWGIVDNLTVTLLRVRESIKCDAVANLRLEVIANSVLSVAADAKMRLRRLIG